MNKAQEKYMNETHNIPIVYDDENYGEAQPEYVRWLEKKICQCSDSDLNAVLGEVPDEKCDKLITLLDREARNFDPFESGLPRVESEIKKYRAIIKEWYSRHFA